MTRDQKKCYYITLIIIVFLMIIGGVWMTGWWMSAKMFVTAFATLLAGLGISDAIEGKM